MLVTALEREVRACVKHLLASCLGTSASIMLENINVQELERKGNVPVPKELLHTQGCAYAWTLQQQLWTSCR